MIRHNWDFTFFPWCRVGQFHIQKVFCAINIFWTLFIWCTILYQYFHMPHALIPRVRRLGQIRSTGVIDSMCWCGLATFVIETYLICHSHIARIGYLVDIWQVALITSELNALWAVTAADLFVFLSYVWFVRPTRRHDRSLGWMTGQSLCTVWPNPTQKSKKKSFQSSSIIWINSRY